MISLRAADLVRTIVVAVIAGVMPWQVWANPCLSAAREAAVETGVPYDVLAAIALTESGRRQGPAFAPWPWTTNAGGEGAFHDSLDAARTAARSAFARGIQSVDIGCFQINHHWHGQHFRSLGEMFDPLANARYAARFVSELHAEFGDWEQAAGAFHSRTEHHAARYRVLFARHRAGIDPQIPTSFESPKSARGLSEFPLLVAGNAGATGSLVPDRGGAGPLLKRPVTPLFAMD